MFAGLEVDSIPPDKAQWNALRSSEIELRNRRSGEVARIPHCRLGTDRMVADLHGELTQCECAVREPEAEWKQWSLATLAKPLISDRCAFIIRSGEYCAVVATPTNGSDGRAIGVALNFRMRQLIFADREGDRQAS